MENTIINVNNIKEVEKVEFKPQNTAIASGFSKSAKMLVNEIKEGSKVLDVGCGKGRNIKYILENTFKNVIVDGSEIREQLDKELDNHVEIMNQYTMNSTFKRCIIDTIENLPINHYDYILNSHVLNVIEHDNIKNEVVRNVYNALVEGGTAYFEVRTKNDVESSKTKIPYGQGYKIKKGKDYTYQEVIHKDKLQELLTNNGFKIVKHIFNSSNHIVKVEK